MHSVAMNERMCQETVMFVVPFNRVGTEQIFIHRVPVVKTVNRKDQYKYEKGSSYHYSTNLRRLFKITIPFLYPDKFELQ